MILNTESIFTKRKTTIFAVLLLIIVGLLVYQSTKFHIVSTNPDTSNVATVAPFLKVNFNKTLSSDSLLVTSSPSIIKSYNVTGKVLVINLGAPLVESQTYTIIVKNVLSSTGEQITNKKLAFKPRYIAYTDLPEDQRKALLEEQGHKPTTTDFVAFDGVDELLNFGVTASQLHRLEGAFLKYSPSAKNISVSKSTIVPEPHNRYSSSTSNFINFDTVIDKKTYRARIDYSNLTDIRLYLYDTNSGSLVYDSKD